MNAIVTDLLPRVPLLESRAQKVRKVEKETNVRELDLPDHNDLIIVHALTLELRFLIIDLIPIRFINWRRLMVSTCE
jgi:hypothetical protein